MSTLTIKERMNAPQIKDAKQNVLSGAVAQAYFRKGTHFDEGTIELASSDLQKVVADKFPNLTVSEIEYALYQGVFGAYGEYYGVNVVTMLSWIAAYYSSDERINFIQKQNLEKALKALPAPAPKTAEEEWAELKQAIIRKYNIYKNTHQFSQIGHIYYDILLKHNIIHPTNEEKKEVFNGIYEREKQLAKLAPPPIRGVVSFRERAMKRAQTVRDIAVDKSIDKIVTDFFDMVIANGGDIESYLTI